MATTLKKFDWTLDLGDLGEIDVELSYSFSPGSPARGPSYSSGGEPADTPEVEIWKIRLFDNEDSKWINCDWMLPFIHEDSMERIIESIIESENENVPDGDE